MVRCTPVMDVLLDLLGQAMAPGLVSESAVVRFGCGSARPPAGVLVRHRPGADSWGPAARQADGEAWR